MGLKVIPLCSKLGARTSRGLDWALGGCSPAIAGRTSRSRANTVAQLVGAVRRVAREVPGAAEEIAAACTGHDYSRPGKPKIDWDDPQAKDALASALVNDANALEAAAAA